MRHITFFILILSGVIASCNFNPGIEIAGNGHSDYKIIIPANADSFTITAANELQKYIYRISSARLDIKASDNNFERKGIWLGETDKLQGRNPGENEITCFVSGDQVIIAGGSSISNLYAVYTFLENELHCRFYSPDAETIPESRKIVIRKNLNYSYNPPVTTRTVHSRLFYNDPEFAAKRKVSAEAFPGYVPVARVHTFNRFLPEEIFYNTHPEYYALRNGKRLPTQLCLTNEDVFRIVSDSVAAMIKRYPDARVISVSQNDNSQYCECNRCMEINNREESPSGSVISFVNRIATEFPDKIISTLAYQYTRKAPAQIKPASNVLITLCSIECDRSGPIAEKCTDFSDDLVAWGKITDHVRIWDYTTQFTNFLAPFPNLYTLQPNIKLFLKNHAHWIFEQHSYHPSELFELRSYLTARLLWNPEINVDSTINDFLDGYYGEAGPYVGKYISLIHSELKKYPDFVLFLYGDPSEAFTTWLNPELLSEYDSLYEKAEQAVAGKPEILKRVKTARLSVDYAILEASRKNLTTKYSMVEIADNGSKKVSADLEKRLNAFKNNCDSAGITLLNETGYTVSEYMDFYRKTLERALQPDLALGKKVTLLQPAKKYANEDPQTLTDGAFGGSSYFSNWLGFDGNNLDAVIDLGKETEIHEISTAFLQVVNHIVFFPLNVRYLYSIDGRNYFPLDKINNERPLTRTSKVNDVQFFTLKFKPVKARYIRVTAENMKTAPVWHFGAGLSTWIFADEVQVQ